MTVAPPTGKATRIDLFSLKTPQMRAFHLTWLAFFVCFFAWFATAPLMPTIAKDLSLTKDQVANIAIAGVFATILARMIIGPLCDRYGPRITYTVLLALGAVPVFLVGFAQDYTSFLIARLFIGVIGASFVVTQYHTSVMFAPNVVGTANATVGGWGNSGGGVTQSVMPVVFSVLAAYGLGASLSWRVAMFLPGAAMVIVAVLYWLFTQDTPAGDIVALRRQGVGVESGKTGGWKVIRTASRNYRVWLLAACYGASFGVELFVHSIAVTYFFGKFQMSQENAGYAVGAFGLLALFARALGGLLSDRIAFARGLGGRTWLLFAVLILEGGFLIAFAKADAAAVAILFLLIFGLFTHIACGAIYALVPFIDRKALGGVTGIVGAGGNVGGVAATFLLRGTGDAQFCFLMLGIAAVVCGCGVALIRFSMAHKQGEQALYDEAVAQRRGSVGGAPPVAVTA